MDVVKKEDEVVFDVIESIVVQAACIVVAEKDKGMDDPKNKYREEVVALLDGIVTQTALIMDAEKDHKCMDNPKIKSGQDMEGILEDITQNRNGIGLEDDTLAQIHPETNSQENEIEIEVPNANSRNFADEKRSPSGGSKRFLKESLFLPYHEETNTGLHNFTGDIAENITVNDENETYRRYFINKINRQASEISWADQDISSAYSKFLSYLYNKAAASGKDELEKKPSSEQIKKKPEELTRHSLMKNLKHEMKQIKEAAFDRNKKIQQTDEEIYDGEADDEEDLDKDGFCPPEKLFPDIKIAQVKAISPSNFGSSQSSTHRSHQHTVVPSSSYMQPTIIQGSQCFASQDSEDIQMICSGQFSHDENQLSAWSPNSQRKMEADENNDVIVIAEIRQSFKENPSLKRKRECSSPSPKNKKFHEEELSSCSSPGGWEETFPQYSPQPYDEPYDSTSPYSPTPTNHGDSSDGERIISGAKKCKVLDYSSEEDDEVNESSVIVDDEDKNISSQVSMVSFNDSVSANDDNKSSSYQKNSEFSEDCSDRNDVEVNKPSNITANKDKNVLPESIESPVDSVSANDRENSLNPMELSVEVKDHDAVLQKPKKINEFLELEAELDSNEEASSDESESEFPEDQKNDLFDDVPINEENPQELAIIHHKYICEDDAQVVKQLQEQYLPGGELHEDGKGRQKKFIWNNNDSSTPQNETLMSDSEQEEVVETSISQEKATWRQKAIVVHGSDSESDDVHSNEKSAKKLPVNIVGKANTSQVINKSFSKASSSSTAITVRRSGSLIGVNGSNKLNLKASNTGQKKTVLFKTVQDAHQQDVIKKQTVQRK